MPIADLSNVALMERINDARLTVEDARDLYGEEYAATVAEQLDVEALLREHTARRLEAAGCSRELLREILEDSPKGLRIDSRYITMTDMKSTTTITDRGTHPGKESDMTAPVITVRQRTNPGGKTGWEAVTIAPIVTTHTIGLRETAEEVVAIVERQSPGVEIVVVR